ncbi:hypothetical protein BGZ54_000032 [Gamsiella multidivaricata]|nr:hypothetical protein BGZ54_000032 [Gamsiella multidivaricata]
MDVRIGRKAKQHPGQVVVALIDSDILVHGMKVLLRKGLRNRTSTSYEMEDVTQKLSVSEAQWIVAAVVTNNDYTSHVTGRSFAKSLAMLESSKQILFDKAEISEEDKASGKIGETDADRIEAVTSEVAMIIEEVMVSEETNQGDMNKNRTIFRVLG